MSQPYPNPSTLLGRRELPFDRPPFWAAILLMALILAEELGRASWFLFALLLLFGLSLSHRLEHLTRSGSLRRKPMTGKVVDGGIASATSLQIQPQRTVVKDGGTL